MNNIKISCLSPDNTVVEATKSAQDFPYFMSDRDAELLDMFIALGSITLNINYQFIHKDNTFEAKVEFPLEGLVIKAEIRGEKLSLCTEHTLMIRHLWSRDSKQDIVGGTCRVFKRLSERRNPTLRNIVDMVEAMHVTPTKSTPLDSQLLEADPLNGTTNINRNKG